MNDQYDHYEDCIKKEKEELCQRLAEAHFIINDLMNTLRLVGQYNSMGKTLKIANAIDAAVNPRR
jgi:uncharacterized protein Smg (DUF494 family)